MSRRGRPRPAASRTGPPAATATGAHLLDRPLLALERRGLAVAAVGVGVSLLLLAMARVDVGLRPTHLGKFYVLLAADPFTPDAGNPVAYRILTPLLSYLVGLRGIRLLITNWILAATLLAAAYAWFRRSGQAPRWSFLGASTLALSMVTLITVRYGGYCDSLTYLLVFLAWWARHRPGLASLLFFLALVNHESAVFLAPWLGFEIAAPPGGGRRLGAAITGIAAALACFVVLRLLQARISPATEYSFTYYLQPLLSDPLHWFRESGGHRLRGVFAAFNLYWVLPLWAASHAWLRGDRRAATSILLPIPCAFAQLLVAYDVTRMTTLAFMSVLLGTEYLLRTRAAGAWAWLLPLSVVNWFIPQVNVAMGVVGKMGR